MGQGAVNRIFQKQEKIEIGYLTFILVYVKLFM